jgi:hypothetical protein
MLIALLMSSAVLCSNLSQAEQTKLSEPSQTKQALPSSVQVIGMMMAASTASLTGPD